VLAYSYNGVDGEYGYLTVRYPLYALGISWQVCLKAGKVVRILYRALGMPVKSSVKLSVLIKLGTSLAIYK
jgi:hypothetical protein